MMSTNTKKSMERLTEELRQIMSSKMRKILRHTALSLAGRMPARLPRRMVRFFYGHHMEEHDAPAFRRALHPAQPFRVCYNARGHRLRSLG